MLENEADRHLELSISAEKDSYYLDEPLYLVVRLTNTSSGPLPVPPPRIEPSGIPSNIGLSVKSSSGSTLQPISREKTGGIEISGEGNAFAALAPQRSWIVVVDMLAAYSQGHDMGNMVFRRGRLQRGEYTVEAFYKASFAHSGIIKSSPFRIRISGTPPWEWAAKKRIQKAHHLFRSEQSESARRKSIDIYKKAIRKNPTSRYLPDAYRMLVEISRSKPGRTIRNAVFDTQSKYRDPVFLYDIAMNLEETDVLDREALIQVLRDIFWRAPASTFAEIVKQRLVFEEMVTNSLKKDEADMAIAVQPGSSKEKQP